MPRQRQSQLEETLVAVSGRRSQASRLHSKRAHDEPADSVGDEEVLEVRFHGAWIRIKAIEQIKLSPPRDRRGRTTGSRKKEKR